MDLVTGAAGALPAKFLELVKEEYKLQTGLQKQVESLSAELEAMRTYFDMVAQLPPDKLDPLTKLWRDDVQEVSYDMEDIVDSFLRVDGGRPQRRPHIMSKIKKLFCSCSLKDRHEIATEIVEIMERLKGIYERHARYYVGHLVPLAEPAGASSNVDPRILALLKGDSDLVGIEKPMNALIERLSLGDEHKSCKKMKIVCIFGSGGLGKTTLAKQVYDKVNLKFDCWAFVSVGQNPETTKLLKDILVGLSDNETEETVVRQDKEITTIQRDKKRNITRADLKECTANDLVQRICKFLQGKRFFIVVDDIWDKNIWVGAIENAFVNSNPGSRIIATTRRIDVAKQIGEPFEIQQLSDDSSRKLLSKIIFDSEDKIENDDLTEKFLHKCHGVPLAITTIGRLLAPPKQRDEWFNVYESIFLNSFGFETENDRVKSVMEILSFSYYHLPCHLRTCMMYLSVFPEDEYVDKNMLIWRWIAEGFVHEEDGKVPFEVGGSYFDELINRSLIQPSERGIHSLVGCRVHDFVLRLIRKLSREENFVCVLDSKQQCLPKGGKVRRLALQNGCLPDEVDDEKKVVARSLNAMSSKMLGRISVAGFKHLRVLALENCCVEEGYLEDIGKLLHLRYLGLTGTIVRKLPEGVGNLKFLQTLMLHGTGIKELPKSLEHCTQLMCLRADETTVVPDWIDKLTSLVELEMYPAGASGAERFVKELGKLRRLRVLKTEIDLRDEGQARGLLESLSKLREVEIVDVGSSSETIHLTEKDATQQQDDPALDFWNNNLRVLILGALRFPSVPARIKSGALQKLYKLRLDLSRLQQEDMQTLGGFPNLRSLELRVAGSFTGNEDIVTCVKGGFQNLVTFVFHAFSSMMIKFEPGAMPGLRDLRFQIFLAFDKHDKLVLDYGLENLRSLQRAEAIIFCVDCFSKEVEEVEAAVRRQVLGIRPNNNPPTLSMRRYEEEGTTRAIDRERMLRRHEVEQIFFRKRCQRLYDRLTKQFTPFTELLLESAKMLLDWEQCGSCYGSLVNKARRMSEECMDSLENAFHGRILRDQSLNVDGLIVDSLWARNQDLFWANLSVKKGEIWRFIQQDHDDVHEIKDFIADLERGLEILTTTEYQRLAAMWEEVVAQHSLQVQCGDNVASDGEVDILTIEYPRSATMWEELQAAAGGEDGLRRALTWEDELGGRLREQFGLYLTVLYPNVSILDSNRNKVYECMRQTLDTVELAVHGRILWRSETEEFCANPECLSEWSDPVWEQLKVKRPPYAPGRGVHEVMDNIASLERALEGLATEYPRLVVMWEELRAEQSLMSSLRDREKQLFFPIAEALELHFNLISPETFELLTFDKMKVVRFVHECYDTLDLAFDGRITWRTQLGSSDDVDHLDYTQERREFKELLDSKFLKLKLVGSDPDVLQLQLKESIACKEALLEKLTVEHPRLAAMLEGLKAELCSPGVLLKLEIPKN